MHVTREPIELAAGPYRVTLGSDLRLTATDGDGNRVWTTSEQQAPAVVIEPANGSGGRGVGLAEATQAEATPYEEDRFRGWRIDLSGYQGSDVALALAFATDAAAGDVLLEVKQTGGADTVAAVHHLYRVEKPVSEGGYMVLPHGSGYLIPADCPDPLPGERGEPATGEPIGARWSLPVFGIVKGDHSLCAIVDTWWDCGVRAEHAPGDYSALDVSWLPSLGRLAYARRMTLHLARHMDYVEMAKLYRQRARREGLVRTLAEKMEETPQIGRYLEGTLVRWAAWNPPQIPEVLDQLARLRDKGFRLNLFYPKWPGEGYSEQKSTATTADGLWQGYLHPSPVPGGWQALVDFAGKARQLGCLIQGFVCPRIQDPAAPQFDPEAFARDRNGQPIGSELSAHGAAERNQAVLRSLQEHGLRMDVLYYDGYSAYAPLPEDFSAAHPTTRRQTYEAQNQCFADARRAGIMPGAELARFWAMRDCDYFFYTDWSSDRLSNAPVRWCPGPVGQPIPLFELVFHDCYIAGFSGGGYALYADGYDWWADQHPRLYELLFVAAPCHNWLPEGRFPYEGLDSPHAEPRWAWLRKMGALCRATKLSEMLSHEFLSADRRQQRVVFANGVVVELDFAADRYRVQGVEGFTGDWETAPIL
jgi:hypothetical protein